MCAGGLNGRRGYGGGTERGRDSTQLARIGPEGKNVRKELQALRQAASEPAEWRQQQLRPPRWRVVQALGEGSPSPGPVLGRGEARHTWRRWPHARTRPMQHKRRDGGMETQGQGSIRGWQHRGRGGRAPGAAATLRRSQEHSCWHSEGGRQASSKEIGGMRWMKGRVLSSKEGSDPI